MHDREQKFQKLGFIVHRLWMQQISWYPIRKRQNVMFSSKMEIGAILTFLSRRFTVEY